MKPRYATLLFVLAATACSGASSPERLAASLQDALARSDSDAILASADLRGAPAMASYMLADLPGDCSGETVCTVTAQPLTAEWTAENQAQMAEQGAEWRVAPEGVIAISGKRTGKDSFSMDLSLPYASIDGQYKLVIGQLTAAKRAELEATTPQAAAEHTLEGGIHDAALGDRDKTWLTTAEILPVGGGDAGIAFLAKVRAVVAAIKAADPDAAAATSEWAGAVFAAKDYDGKPIPLDERKRKLRAQGFRMVVDANVLGGYRKGDTAVLIIDGTNGVGNIVRGAQLMDLEGGVWTDSGGDLIEITPQG